MCCLDGHVRFLVFAMLLAAIGISLPSLAQNPSPQSSEQSARELVRQTVANEVSAGDKPGTKLMFLSRKRTSQGFETKLNVETVDATAALLIEQNSHPISAEQMREEDDRLRRLSNNPNELHRRKHQEQQDSEHSLRIMKALPDAFLYQFDGTQPGTASLGKEGDELVRLKFRPDPNYSCPSHVEQVLAGMQGTLLIDKNAHRIARIDAVLFKEVTFGWGILGHLDKGGSFQVDQAEVSPGDWELTRTRLNLTGKVMMLKRLVIESDETDTDFRTVPSDTNFAQGVELLKSEETKMEQARLPKKEEPDPTVAKRNRR
jgi:hypothetical protein